jgi:hypothetical protein
MDLSVFVRPQPTESSEKDMEKVNWLTIQASRTWRTTQIDSKISRQDIGYTVYTPSFVPAVKLPPDFAARRIAWL